MVLLEFPVIGIRCLQCNDESCSFHETGLGKLHVTNLPKSNCSQKDGFTGLFSDFMIYMGLIDHSLPTSVPQDMLRGRGPLFHADRSNRAVPVSNQEEKATEMANGVSLHLSYPVSNAELTPWRP